MGLAERRAAKSFETNQLPALKKVVIKSSQNVYSGDRIATFEGGVLTLDHEPTTNVDDVAGRAKGIQATLEKNL